MHKKEFIGLHHVKSRSVIMVDGSYLPNALILSHWKELNRQPFADDTSTGIVLNGLLQNPEIINDWQYVTATHFDIDGFLGVWAVFYPELALSYCHVLEHAAKIGDFREFEYQNSDAHEALKIVCLLNALEKKLFYPPFGTKQEAKSCVAKFEYFISRFSHMLTHISHYQKEWITEFEKVLSDCKILYSHYSSIQKYPAIGLTVIRTPKPLHYYALFGATIGTDIVLSIYPNNQYELEYKYTTWIDLVRRPTLPRVFLDKLASTLNQVETSGYRWAFDKITDGGPMLRLNNVSLTRQEKFDNPYTRNFASSSISSDEIEKIVVDFFEKAYRTVIPQKNWTWRDIRNFNKNLFNEDLQEIGNYQPAD